MNETQTPSYIKALLQPSSRKPAGRKAWSIDLEQVWIPFFLATNTVGDTCLPPDSLGAPIRLAYDADGSVRFSKAGRPVTKIEKELAGSIRVVRDNFTAGLQGFTEQVMVSNEAGYKAQVKLARKAGSPIMAKDKANLDKAFALAMEKAIAEAEAVAEPVAEAEGNCGVKTHGKEKVPVTA